MARSKVAGRAWDMLSIGTIGVLGILGVRRRHEADVANEKVEVLIGGPMTSAPLDLSHACCIVTGASSGIGEEVAWGMAKAGAARVEMACRNLDRCEETRAGFLARCLAEPMEEVRTLGTAEAASSRASQRRRCAKLHQNCVCSYLELTDPASVRAFVARSALQEKPFGTSTDKHQVVLVNNAGTMGEACSEAGGKDSDAGSDRQLWTNHYGHFLPTRLLLPVLGTNSHIVIVASRAHRQGSLHIHQANGEPISSDDIEQASGGTVGFTRFFEGVGLAWYARYARSKLCNVLLASELRRRYPDGPVCIAVSPGLVNTGLFAGTPPFVHRPLSLVARLLFQTPEEGAAHVLSALRVLQNYKGGSEEREVPPMYWHCGQPERPSAAAEDPDLGAALWRASDTVVGLS